MGRSASGRGLISVGTLVRMGSLGRAQRWAVGRYLFGDSVGQTASGRRYGDCLETASWVGTLWPETAWVYRSEPQRTASVDNKLLAYEE